MAAYNAHIYARNGLATTGLAIMNARVAYELRPDLWSSLQDCAIDFNRKFEATNVRRLTAEIEGYGTVLVLARSMDRLAERIEWIVGRPVHALDLAEPEARPAPRPDPLRQEADRKKADRFANLRKLAAQELPSHDCSLRREILAAREELGLEAVR